MAEAEHLPLFLNRELSWLDFNARVLHEALDDRNALLERLKFLAIFASNLDEFYMVRVGGLRRRAIAGVARPFADGLGPQEVLAAIDAKVRDLTTRQRACVHEELLPALAAKGIRLLHPEELSPAEWEVLDDYFEAQVYPVLTPLAVDPGHPFPYLSNLSLSLAVALRDDAGAEHFARVKVPRSLSRWVPVGRAHQFVPLEECIAANLDVLFPGMEILGCYLFRVTRYSDFELTASDEPDDLLATIEEHVFRRRFGEVVRLEVQREMPRHLRRLILEELREHADPAVPELSEREVVDSDRLLDLAALLSIATLEVPELRDPPFVPVIPRELRQPLGSIFDVIRERDLLVHHPFDSFSATVEEFVEQAARDPDVLAIKMTLYRTSGDTAIVRALLDAAQRGKEVVVLVELKARFDEANNIEWARMLESHGVHVVYGSAELKTHAKTSLVVRREPDGFRLYAHIGSGNYNTRSARVYTDVGLFTCERAIGSDLRDLFNSLTAFPGARPFRKLLVAPGGLRTGFVELIEREARHASAGRPAHLIAKMNALVDEAIITALCHAARAGVTIDIIARGICCLRPGVPGVSDRIRVISIVGRFLEHSRLWYFANGGSAEYYLGSADWMPRNFDRRVEAVAPVEDRSLHPRLHALLTTCLQDNRQAWELFSDGCWRQRTPGAEAERATHRILLGDPWGMVHGHAAQPGVPAETGIPAASLG